MMGSTLIVQTSPLPVATNCAQSAALPANCFVTLEVLGFVQTGAFGDVFEHLVERRRVGRSDRTQDVVGCRRARQANDREKDARQERPYQCIAFTRAMKAFLSKSFA